MKKMCRKGLSFVMAITMLMSSMGMLSYGTDLEYGGKISASGMSIKSDPFALMYDSDERLAEEIERTLDFELERSLSKDTSNREEESGVFNSAKEAQIIKEQAKELVLSGQRML